MFITDGHHLPAEFVKVAIRAKSIERFIVTSDCTSIAGMPPGEYSSLGAVVVLEPSGRLYVKGSDSLAGSSSSQAECMAWLRSLGLLTEAELRQVCRVNPLRLLGYDI
jgi:N-acetylglucosamine-6-phosphate deacetylase